MELNRFYFIKKKRKKEIQFIEKYDFKRCILFLSIFICIYNYFFLFFRLQNYLVSTNFVFVNCNRKTHKNTPKRMTKIV